MPEPGFGIENLPYRVVRRGENPPSPAVRLGNDAIDLHDLALQSVPARGPFPEPTPGLEPGAPFIA